MLHGIDSPILKDMCTWHIDCMRGVATSNRIIFDGFAYLMRKENSCKRIDGSFRWKNIFETHDDVQKNIIGIMPF